MQQKHCRGGCAPTSKAAASSSAGSTAVYLRPKNTQKAKSNHVWMTNAVPTPARSPYTACSRHRLQPLVLLHDTLLGQKPGRGFTPSKKPMTLTQPNCCGTRKNFRQLLQTLNTIVELLPTALRRGVDRQPRHACEPPREKQHLCLAKGRI